ncbi:MAG: hypothetical protein H5U21_03145 [Porphyrobacter sp.]|nr:hypothetical protein [Porphyrobacter sp.]
MEDDFSRPAEPDGEHRRAPLRLIAAVAAVAFVLGAMAFYWLASSDLPGIGGLLAPEPAETASPAAPDPGRTPAPAPVPSASDAATAMAAASDVREAAERVEAMAEHQGGLDSRVAAMEQRLAQLELRAQAAAGNAARAEALLITFAARRALERGAPLGYLADQLRLRFGDAQPNAVQTVIDAALRPVTLDQLIARFNGLAPALAEPPPEDGALSRLGRELSELFVIRREDSPSPAAERRLGRARLFLESGRIPAAIAEMRRLPNPAPAADWIADAQRYAEAQRALELLETTAILEQRELRDGSGARVEQPSPAQAADSVAP